MNVLVTGGSGSLARYICQEFADHNLLLADITPPPADRAHLPFKQTDLTSFEDCKAAIALCQPEAILALAAIPYASDDDRARESSLRFRGPPLPERDATMQVNVMGLYYLMMAAVEAGVKTVIHTGSIVSVVGAAVDYRYLPVDDDHPGYPDESYRYSKMAGELMLQWFTRSYGIQTLVPRPAANATPERLQQVAQQPRPTTAWSPHLWHYVDVRDVAWAHRLMFEAREKLLPHDAFLIHAPDHMAPEDSRELVAKFRPDLLNAIPVYLRERQAFVSCQKAHNAFGYQGRYSWTDFV